MQQTVDVAVKEMKDLDLETIPAYGLSCFYSAVADAATDVAITTVAETTVSGSSSFFAAVVASADAVTITAADAGMDL